MASFNSTKGRLKYNTKRLQTPVYYIVWNIPIKSQKSKGQLKSNSHKSFHYNHLFPFINSSFSTCMSFYFILTMQAPPKNTSEN